MSVLVTGASGGIGSAIIETLRRSGAPVRGLCRNPSGVPMPEPDLFVGDLAKPRSLRAALHDVRAVFLYSFPEPDGLPALVTEFRSAGVEKVVVLSTIDTTRDEPFVEYNRERHLAVENAMVDGGFTCVCLRPGAFARNAVRFWGEQIRAERLVRLPFPESRQAPIADEDIAAVAVRSLTSDALDHRRIVLTGPESLTMRRQVALIGAAIGEPIDVDEISEPAARTLYGRVLPPAYLDLLMGQWAFEVTEDAVVTDAVATITGRDPIDYGTWALTHRAMFA
ncbi:SDR family oxidoreductase [Mycolicibacterium sediminis]|uniref:Nucleotide-diphosphate-sugar epimerase n=1 Tax=Mycolicibacterium sediminis TaxID=1286180 RepID=A0A7I7QVT5_9MYCO|nr:NAD(P)H-binding protein [Mycolicibacterium sediminis]BBY30453.1 nucleotide-diphosphate-sugar epimerase [Mycolicibacterium sediminis]